MAQTIKALNKTLKRYSEEDQPAILATLRREIPLIGSLQGYLPAIADKVGIIYLTTVADHDYYLIKIGYQGHGKQVRVSGNELGFEGVTEEVEKDPDWMNTFLLLLETAIPAVNYEQIVLVHWYLEVM